MAKAAASASKTPEVGKPAPAFALPASSGKPIKLSDFKGEKAVVLYFYPKDNTPGCTTEACQFRDHHPAFAKEGVVVLGVSPDSLKSHDKFVGKFDLPFALLADENHEIAEKYGAWQKKKFLGKSYMGVVRSTFVIDRQGKLAHTWPKVKADGHAEEVLAWIRENLS